MELLRKLWIEDSGATLSTELILVTTIVVIGAVVGLAAVRAALVESLEDSADAMSSSGMNSNFGSMVTPGVEAGAGVEFFGDPTLIDPPQASPLDSNDPAGAADIFNGGHEAGTNGEMFSVTLGN